MSQNSEDEYPPDPESPSATLSVEWFRANFWLGLVWLSAAVVPPLLVITGIVPLPIVYVAWYFPLLLLIGSSLHPDTKPWLKRNFLWLVTLLISIAVFFGVPQVRYVWYSQTPDSLSASGTGWWLVFAIALILMALLFSVSVYVVPRRIRPVPDGAGRWTRYVLRPVDILISWPVSIRNKLRRYGSGLLGLALIFIGILAWLPAQSADSQLIPDVPLTGVLWHHACFGFVLLGTWLVLAAIFVADRQTPGIADLVPDGRHVFLMTLGRLLGWLVVLYAIDEVLWFVCASDYIEIISLRVYALWGVAAFFMLAIVAAGSLDFLDDRVKRIPVRIIGMMVVLLIMLLRRPAPNSDVTLQSRLAEKLTDQEFSKLHSEAAYHHLEMRIRTIPDDQPVVLVAASGGGSRAAIFTSLVYERLARLEIGDENAPDATPRTWADNIVLISSVSGGSLATAHFAERSCRQTRRVDDLKYTMKSELAAGIQSEIKRLLKSANRTRGDTKQWQDTEARAVAILDALDQPDGDHPDLWIVQNPFTDDMCINFMAPILRGALALTMFRGQALGSFWDDVFHWRGSTNLDGYASAASGENAWYGTGEQPVVLFNTCEISGGSRVTVGFPPLPKEAFSPESAKHRSPPRELALNHPDYHVSVSLSRAVRFSSNFPWGFHSAIIEFPKSTLAAERMQLLDGGVTDNTGIDSVFELMLGLQERESDGSTDLSEAASKVVNRRHRLLRLLRSRTVVLLEIDSGAKPSRPGGLSDFLGVFAGPIQALSNATYSNAEIARDNYIRRLRSILDSPASVLPAAGQSTNESAKPDDVRQFHHYTVQCNHFSRDNPDMTEVMTAWALSPQQKASVIARFVLELDRLDKQLAGLSATARLRAETRRLQEQLQTSPVDNKLTDALEAHAVDGERLTKLLEQEQKSAHKSAFPKELALELQTQIQIQQKAYSDAEQVLNDPRTTAAVDKEQAERSLNKWRGQIATNRRKLDELLRRKGMKIQQPSDKAVNNSANQFSLENFVPAAKTAQNPQERQQIQQRLQEVINRSMKMQKSLRDLDSKGKAWFDQKIQREEP